MSADSSPQNNFNLRMLLVLSFGHLATDICQSALPAVLPFLKAKLLLSYTTAGVILLASNITSSVIQPLFGYLSDLKEKAFMLPMGCLCAGLGLSFLSIPDRYGFVLLLVIVSGLGIASYHPEGFKTARFFTGRRTATGLAVFTVGGNIGLALGPLAATFITTYFGFDYLPLLLALPLVFVLLLAHSWPLLAHARTQSVARARSLPSPSKAAYVSVGLTVATVIMRSWTHFGLMAYIPFYYIDYEKGDPLYAGTLVSVFLLGGAIGTLAGSHLADRWGYKRYLILSLALTSLLLPLILVTHGLMLFVTLGVVGMALISSFTVTIVMAQELLPNNLGIASGLMAGFAIGTGGIGVTLLGVIADHFGAPAALKSIMLLPLMGLLASCFIRFPIRRRTEAAP
ncbi:MAG: MFS transporter [Deltaproteobacteria bacterium]|nr:MFS transporter [Deltaproteobacteria bacterium]